MSTANAPLTKAVLRSLLWDGGTSAAAAAPDTQARVIPVAPIAPPVRTYAPPPSPAPQQEIQLDELTIAKMRLLELRRPPSTIMARVARSPVPWVVGALLVGMVFGRSKAARLGALWIGKKIATRTFRAGANRFAGAQKPAPNGRFRTWMNPLS